MDHRAVRGRARGLTRRASSRASALGDQKGPLSRGHLVDQRLEVLAFLDPPGDLLAQGDGDVQRAGFLLLLPGQ